MKKAYLLIYDANVGTRDQVKEVLNMMPTVYTWRFDIPHSFYVISESSAEALYEDFVSRNGKQGRFMFIEASDNRQGLMLADTWYLLTHKQRKPKD